MSTDNESRVESRDAAKDTMISIEDVTKTYEGKGETVTALKDINIEIETGEFLTIVGPSGCGKTTLLHLAAGILEPSNGQVTIDGINVQSPAHEKHSVGLVFQSPVLLEWRTVLKNILLPIQIMTGNGSLEGTVDDYRDEAHRLIELVGLEGFDNSYPQELSGGMQQRVTICQSLIYDPDVLLMDEPFGSLDALTKKQLNSEFLEIWNEKKKTVIFVTHDLEEAIYLSDRVIVMSPRPGRIVDVIDVDIDRPRTDQTRTTDEFRDHVAEALEHFSE